MAHLYLSKKGCSREKHENNTESGRWIKHDIAQALNSKSLSGTSVQIFPET